MPRPLDIAYSTFRVLFPSAYELLAGIPIVHYLGPIGASIFFKVTDIFLTYLVLHGFWHALYCLSLPIRWTFRITICLFKIFFITLFLLNVLVLIMATWKIFKIVLGSLKPKEEAGEEEEEVVEGEDEETFVAEMDINWKTGETTLEWREGDIMFKRYGLIPTSALANVKEKYDKDGTILDEYLPLSITPIPLTPPPPEPLGSPFEDTSREKLEPKYKKKNKDRNKKRSKKEAKAPRHLHFGQDTSDDGLYSEVDESTASTAESPLSVSKMQDKDKDHRELNLGTSENEDWITIPSTPEFPTYAHGFFTGSAMAYEACGLETPDGPIYFEGDAPSAPDLARVTAGLNRALRAHQGSDPVTSEGTYYSEGPSTPESPCVVTPAFVASPLESPTTVLGSKYGKPGYYGSLEGSTLGLSESE